jgi:hypothetical protein
VIATVAATASAIVAPDNVVSPAARLAGASPLKPTGALMRRRSCRRGGNSGLRHATRPRATP